MSQELRKKLLLSMENKDINYEEISKNLYNYSL